MPAPAPLQNWIVNGDFRHGLTSWVITSDINYTVYDRVLNVFRMNTSKEGVIRQDMSFNAAPGQALEASFLAGNTSANPKSIRVYLTSAAGGLNGAVMCTYTIAANTPLTPYRLIGPVGAGWSGQGVALQIFMDTADNQRVLLLDDVAVRQHMSAVVPATDCAWNGLLSAQGVTGMAISAPVQLPGIPDGLGTLPPPMGYQPTGTVALTPAPTLVPPTATGTPVTLPTASPTLAPTLVAPTAIPPTAAPTLILPTATLVPAVPTVDPAAPTAIPATPAA
jgi:hypothetical protein